MILTIAGEQLRRQRGYVAALALIVAAAVGFATFAATMAATQGTANLFADEASGDASNYYATAALTDASLPQLAKPTDGSAANTGLIADYGSPIQLADLKRAIDDANTAGAHVRADASAYGSITGADVVDPLQASPGWTGSVSAMWGSAPWSQILAAGRAPGSGEIVISGQAAKVAGVSIGDSVKVWAQAPTVEPTAAPIATLRVSGIAHDYGPGWRSSPAFISASGVDTIGRLITASSPEGYRSPVQVQVGWEQPNQALADHFSLVGERTGAGRLFGSSSPIAWLVAAALTLGTIVVAFALGRSQAQDRVRWTATARALGARRSHLLAAAGFEWAVIAATAGAVGIGAGVGAAAIAHRVWLHSIASPPPVSLTFPGIVAVAMAALAALLAAVTVIAPAVAAVRVPPTAALKDTPAVDEAEVSRRVSAWPVGMLFATFYVALLVAMVAQSSASYAASVFLFPATAVTGIATAVEVNRRVIRAVGGALAGSAKPWALQAGLSLKAHPRQAVAIANIQTLAVAGIVGWYVSGLVGQSFGWFGWGNSLRVGWVEMVRNSLPHPWYLVAAFLTANALAAVVMWSTARLSRAEGATARALGLSGLQSMTADATAWIASQYVGIVFGWLAGVFGIGGIAAAVAFGGASQPGLAAVQMGFGHGIQASLVAALLALVLAAVVAGLTAATLRPRTAPVTAR